MSLRLRKEKAGLSLKKRNLKAGMARMGLALDTSGSAEDLYLDGTMQDVVELTLGLALGLDNDGKMPMWDFDTKVTSRPEATADNLTDYVKRDILGKNRPSFGGTYYAPVIRAALEFWFTAPPAEKVGWLRRLKGEVPPPPPVADMSPAVLLILTDGDNLEPDLGPCERALKAAQDSKVPLYFVFVGIGTRYKFEFVKLMAGKFSNVGFFPVPDISKISDEDFYEAVGKELTRWLTADTAQS